MRSSVLTSKRAKYLATLKDLALKLQTVERTQVEHSAHIEQIDAYIQRLIEPAPESSKRRFGFPD